MTNKTKRILGTILLMPMILGIICIFAFLIVDTGWELLIVILILVSACVGAYMLGEIEK